MPHAGLGAHSSALLRRPQNPPTRPRVGGERARPRDPAVPRRRPARAVRGARRRNKRKFRDLDPLPSWAPLGPAPEPPLGNKPPLVQGSKTQRRGPCPSDLVPFG